MPITLSFFQNTFEAKSVVKKYWQTDFDPYYFIFPFIEFMHKTKRMFSLRSAVRGVAHIILIHINGSPLHNKLSILTSFLISSY